MKNTFPKWWQRRAGQCEARATSISEWIYEQRATTQCPARRASTGLGRLWALLSALPNIHQGLQSAQQPYAVAVRESDYRLGLGGYSDIYDYVVHYRNMKVRRTDVGAQAGR